MIRYTLAEPQSLRALNSWTPAFSERDDRFGPKRIDLREESPRDDFRNSNLVC
jgi:hypothetical protein